MTTTLLPSPVKSVTNEEPNDEVIYPDSDGQPMADNTLQYQWISVLKSGFDALFASDPDVFVAGDLLWYPVRGKNTIRQAPDVLVAFGRPKGYRGSYRQWQENNIAPQIVFEVLSPGNRTGEMAQKASFYDRYGVEEYYILDPGYEQAPPQVDALVRSDVSGHFLGVDPLNDFVSPRSGIRFEWAEGELLVYRPDGERFKTYLEILAERDRATAERDRVIAERNAVREERDRERLAREQAELELQQLRERLQAAGIE